MKLRRTQCFGRQGGCRGVATEAPLRVVAHIDPRSSAWETDTASPDATMQWRRCFMRASRRRMGKLSRCAIDVQTTLWYNTPMNVPTVKSVREELGHSQRAMAALLGVSTKAVQSYEQGWRKTPPHVEQMVLLQVILRRHPDLRRLPRCWRLNKCSKEIRRRCPSAKLKLPGFCWFITGTLCHGGPAGTWTAKRALCLQCEVMKGLLEPAL
jgi:DNA-binding transcriptional regulator YiaG